MPRSIKRLLALGLIAGHGLVHVTLPFVDIIIHAVAALLFLWSFRHAHIPAG